MKIETWKISAIQVYEKNARKIPQRAIDSVAASLKEFGWRQPIVVDSKGVIIVGHVRRLAAIHNGWKEAPVHVAKDLTAAQIRAYRLMDNRSHDEATWDLDILRLEMIELKTLDLDLGLTGFSSRELDALLKADAPREDELPAPPQDLVTQPGDLWTMGKHRLLCGDSTNAEDVLKVLGMNKPALMVTDPPYGVAYDPEWRLDRGVNKPWQKTAKGTVKNDDRSDWRAAWALFPGDIVYVWHAALHSWQAAESILAVPFEIRAQIIWAKKNLVMGRGAYHWQHEPCWYAVRKGAKANWRGDRKQSTVWAIENMHVSQGNVDDGKTDHSTQKPVECMRRPILNHTKSGEAVYDPFLGSGTTLVACELTGRTCFAIDVEPKYVDMAVARWMKISGRPAVNQDGVCFPDAKEA